MRSIYVLILGMMLLSSRVWAQDENIATATAALQSVLSTLKQSVEKLSLDNDQLAAKDQSIRRQVSQLQMQLGSFEARGDVLNKTAEKLQDKTPGRAQQITRMEAENADLDDRAQKAEGAIKPIQQSMDEKYKEDQKLLLQLKGMSYAPSPLTQVRSPGTQEAQRLQKEKLRLMKMINDSQQRQEALQGEIIELQKNTPMLPGASALAHQQILKEQIKDLEAQLTAYPQEKFSANPGASDQWNENQLYQLALELKTLEKNYVQLKGLMEQMGKKTQAARMTVSQHVEGEKLQSSIDDLDRQGESLRADLDDLRSQMVDLDKRKSQLEMMVRQLP